MLTTRASKSCLMTKATELSNSPSNTPNTLNDIICATLEAEFRVANYARIGMFDQAKLHPIDLPTAQQRFSEMLAQTVAAANAETARILLAGAVLEPVAQALTLQGFSIVWQPELFTQEQEVLTSFDCVVVAGTYRYLDQLPIFSRCRELLGEGGALFVFGEYLADDSVIEYSSLANLSSQRQLAERLGFRSENLWDHTANALQSVTQILPLLQQHAEQVRDTLSLSPATWSANLAVLATMQRELESGRRVYQLQQWSTLKEAAGMGKEDRLGEYAKAEYGDIHSFAVTEIQQLFERSFGKSFDAALWHWKYQLGDGKCIVARITRGGEIVAHYGGAPRKILFFGNPSMAIQVCDVMVLPEKRRQYGKSSLFFKVAATFLEREIGNTVNHLLGFGFPNQSAMNIATRLGLYEKTDDFVEIQFPASGATPGLPEYVGFNPDYVDHWQQIDRLWEAMSRCFAEGIVGVRDSQYIKYRYFDHPGATRGQYRCLFLTVADMQAPAFVVLKQHGNCELLMDMLCPVERIPEVIRALQQLVRADQPDRLLCLWLTRGWLAAIPLEGAIVKELNIEIPCNSWNPGPAAAQLYGKWWLTAGDMDFM